MTRPLLKPDRFLAAAWELDPKALLAQGLRYILLDIDNTIVARGTSVVVPQARDWITALRCHEIALCLLSNNWHKVVLNYAEELQLPLVYRAIKSLPFAFIKAKRMIGARARQTLVVGDQLLTDVAGGKLLGMRTLLVRPLAEQDLRHTLLLRRLERRLLGDLQPEGGLSVEAGLLLKNSGKPGND